MSDFLTTQFGLRGRRALVTGGSRGIGRAIAEAFASAGAEVLVHYHRNRDGADEVVRGIEQRGGTAWSARADLTKAQEIAALFAKARKRWGALDILVNNAGDMCERCRLAEMSDALMERLIRTNFQGTLMAARAAIPLLERGRDPVIINMTSVSAHHGGGPGVIVYAAAKGAVLTFTRGLAKELAPGIRVNGIAPGVIMTDLHRNLSTKAHMRGFKKAALLKRIGEPSECAAPAVFLASPAASFITGETLEINGGIWLA